MSTQAAGLFYSVRIVVVGVYLARLLLLSACLMVPPAAVAMAVGHWSVAGAYAATGTVSVTLWLAIGRRSVTQRIQTNEAMAIAALAFILFPLLGAIPFVCSGLSPENAVFEAVSAITTTGLSVAGDPESLPPSLLFGRAWLQWYGGLGIVVLSLALLFRPGPATKTLFDGDQVDGGIVAGTRAHARYVLVIYVLLTVSGVLALAMTGAALEDAVLYTLAGISTGGFAPHSGSLSALPFPAAVALSGICLAGAIPFVCYMLLHRKGWRACVREFELPALLLVVAATVSLLTVMLFLRSGMPLSTALLHGSFLGLSAQTTTGFSSTAIADLDAASKAVLLLAMVVGGGSGSTAGGIKVARLLLLARAVAHLVRRAQVPPHAVLDVRRGRRRISSSELRDALAVILCFLSVVGVSWLAFLAGGYRPFDALFEVVSATGTAGLSTGLSGPELPVVLKGVLCADMIMGRLEMIAFLVLLYPRTWLGRRAEAR